MNRPNRIATNVEFNVAGVKTKGEVEIYTRGGTKSPELEICIINGKRYTPYALGKACITFTPNGLFGLIYGNLIQDLVPNRNSFLGLIKKDDGIAVPFYDPIILGKEHGVIK